MRYYTMDTIQSLYRYEKPSWPEDKIQQKAKAIHQLLNTLDVRWKRSNEIFYQKVIRMTLREMR